MKNCPECGNPIDLKVGEALSDGAIIGEGANNICRSCMEKGWKSFEGMTSAEIAKEFEGSGLEVPLASPIQRHDL